MRTSIKKELTEYVSDLINERVLTKENRDDWHYHAFREDYYLIGYHQCSEWLKHHGINPFEAIAICQQYEIDNFGEVGKPYDNAEKTMNMLAYIYGEQVVSELELKTEQWNTI